MKNQKDIVLGALLDLETQQKRMTEMLFAFDDFCRKNNLTYYLAYGTLLGAIRHHGFIPWDDDVDIVMPRADYERLEKQFKSISNELDVVSFRDKRYYHPFPHINLIDRKTYRVSHATGDQTGQGLFLDIFPLDTLPDDDVETKKTTKAVLKIDQKRAMCVFRGSFGKGIKAIILHTYALLMRVYDPVKLSDKIDRLSKQYVDILSEKVGVFKFPRSRWQKKWYEETAEADFSGRKLMIPGNYDEVLKTSYGDYMQLPPKETRIQLHPAEVYWKL